MLTEVQKMNCSSLRVELIDLNILACFYIRKLNRTGYLFQNSTRHFMLEEFIALRYMENGIIFYLTNLDDDSSLFSFRQILKSANKFYKDQKGIKELKNKFSTYRKNVNELKVKHRNNRIAHLNYLADLNMDKFLNFESYLKTVNR